eukprot:scaffold3084_cov144-Cylindrotheca_fusiformis.AAC.45
MSSESASPTPPKGSWKPFIVLASLFIFRWIISGQSGPPVRIRRWWNTKVPCRVTHLVHPSKWSSEQ